MQNLPRILKKLGLLKKGANTMEYAMMISLACIVAVPSLRAIGNVLYTKSTDCSAYKYTGGCPSASEDPDGNGGDNGDNEGSNPGGDNGNGNGDNGNPGGGGTPVPTAVPTDVPTAVPSATPTTDFEVEPTIQVPPTNTPVVVPPTATRAVGGTTGGGKTPDEREGAGPEAGADF